PESGAASVGPRLRRVLSKYLLSCHGVAPQGAVLLDTREHPLKGGPSGAAVVPGDPEKSLLIQAVRQGRERLKMPPGTRLSDQELADLVEWVKQGAAWAGGALAAGSDEYRITPEQKGFWSFQPPAKPSIPKVKKASWA